MEIELTDIIVNDLLRYVPETGKLFWETRKFHYFDSDRIAKGWNFKYSGTEAFTTTMDCKYKRGTIFYTKYLAHRVIWLMQTGNWPNGQIDHINGIRDDNRWVNLRDVTQSQNQKNSSKRSNNKSGVVGVYWNPINKNWRASINSENKSKDLGSYPNKQDAINARVVAEIEFGFHPNHGKELI